MMHTKKLIDRSQNILRKKGKGTNLTVLVTYLELRQSTVTKVIYNVLNQTHGFGMGAGGWSTS